MFVFFAFLLHLQQSHQILVFIPLFFYRFMLFLLLLMIVSEIGKIILSDSYNQFLSVRCNSQKNSFSHNKLFMLMIFYRNSLDYLDH